WPRDWSSDVCSSDLTLANQIPRATGETRAVTYGGKMWVLGGGRTSPNPSTEVDIYDPVAGTWSTGVPMLAARRNFPADTDGTKRSEERRVGKEWRTR